MDNKRIKGFPNQDIEKKTEKRRVSRNKVVERDNDQLAPSQLEVWEAYIAANAALIDAKSIPFKVGEIQHVKSGKNKWNDSVTISEIATVQPDIKKELIQNLIDKKILLNEHHLNLENEYLHTSHLDVNGRKNLNNIFNDFLRKYPKVVKCDSRPVRSGSIKSIKDDYKNLTDKIGITKKIGIHETIFCTISDIRNIDIFARKHQYIKREPEIAAVLKIYKYNESEIIKKMLSDFLNVDTVEISVYNKFEWTEGEKIDYENRKQLSQSFEIQKFVGDDELLEDKLLEFGFVRDNWIGYFECINDLGEIIIEEKTTSQVCSTFILHYFRLKTKYMSVKLIHTKGSFRSDSIDFSIKKIQDKALSLLVEEGFNVSRTSNGKASVSFDVINGRQLQEKLTEIEKLNIITHSYKSIGDDFRYKVRLTIENPDLNLIAEKLKSEFTDAIDLEFSENKYALNFNFYSDSNGFTSFENRIFELEEEFAVKVDYDDSKFSNCYYFKVDLELQKSLFLERLEQLSGVEFYSQKILSREGKIKTIKGDVLGNLDLKKSDFRKMVFNLTLDTNEAILASNELKSLNIKKDKLGLIVPDLTGDLSKNNYLKEAITKITNPSNNIYGREPVNKNIGHFIFDSSKAKPINTQSLIDERKIIENFLHSKNINDSQIDSVVKAVLAEDLALLQGPPGTGKTTVIAEMIWQLIRKKQKSKILLTSESNLAVDNALSRLLNSKNMIVKPIRFGRNVQENEGKQFQIERIEKWSLDDGNTNNEENNNAVQYWLNTVVNRVNESEQKSDSALMKWKKELGNPSSFTKKIFKEAYLENVNVIGNTCSSSGSPDFIFSFHQIFNPKIESKLQSTYKYHYKKDGFVSKDKVIGLPLVEFDTVIMDEASKATPPELLLPLTFGVKSIIIGDHRQLPPSLNEEDFKESLESIGKSDLAENWTKKDYQTSQFERLFLNSNISSSIKGSFNKQFRMHPQINEVIKQFYIEDGGLECGLPLTEVDDPNLNNNASRAHNLNHKYFITPDTHTIWVNVNEPELSDGTSKVNEAEVEAIRRVLKYLKHSDGFTEYMNFWKNPEDKEIGIISFYGKQMNRLKVLNKEFPKLNLLMKTVDRFQGMERNIIIVSTVRSNKSIEIPHQKASLIKFPNNGGYRKNSSLGFAETPQRLNVALSRAKRLLIVVGNADHFSQNKMYKNVIETIRGSNQDEITFIDYKELNQYS